MLRSVAAFRCNQQPRRDHGQGIERAGERRFLGVSEIAFHTAGGAAALNYGANREEFLQPHDEAVAAPAAA